MVGAILLYFGYWYVNSQSAGKKNWNKNNIWVLAFIQTQKLPTAGKIFYLKYDRKNNLCDLQTKVLLSFLSLLTNIYKCIYYEMFHLIKKKKNFHFSTLPWNNKIKRTQIYFMKYSQLVISLIMTLSLHCCFLWSVKTSLLFLLNSRVFSLPILHIVLWILSNWLLWELSENPLKNTQWRCRFFHILSC